MSADHHASSLDAATTTSTPLVAVEELRGLAAQHWGIHAVDVDTVTGERDQNVRIRGVDGGRYLLKMVHMGEPPAETDMVTAAMIHVAEHAPDLPVQAILPARGGRGHLQIVTADGHPRTARMTRYLDGVPATAEATTDTVLTSIGHAVAVLDAALADFTHPGADRLLVWDLTRSDLLRPMLADLGDHPDAPMLEQHLAHFDDHVAPRLAATRRQVIHGDLTRDNILIDPVTEKVAGIIDFGDMIRSHLINDVAIAAAHHLDSSNDGQRLLLPAQRIIGGFHQVLPLTADELALVFDLLVARTVQRLIITAWRAARFPENRAYILRHQVDSAAVLQLLRAVDGDRFTQHLLHTLTP